MSQNQKVPDVPNNQKNQLNTLIQLILDQSTSGDKK